MKYSVFFLILVLSALPFQSVAANNEAKNIITLTAQGIDSADDIEAAIIAATAGGSRQGTVILDGQKGAFLFTGDDRSLNIFVSNLTLRGVNNAVVENCDDGLFFDGFPLMNIFVEMIAFLCTGDGIEAVGTFKDVTLRDNTFWAGNNGFSVGGNPSAWLIQDNYIQAARDGMRISGADDFKISGNYISGNIGIVLLTSSQFQIHQNNIQAKYQGILLGNESWKNLVQGNTILGVNAAGIALEPSVVNNRILANRVICGNGVNCLTVDAQPLTVDSNKIAGNKP